jgi:16S rRNA (guanine527-N7)-methyltransferase
MHFGELPPCIANLFAFSETETETEIVDQHRLTALLAPYLGGAVLNDTQLSQLASYLDLLLRWNARMNLTAIREPEPIVTRHFGESLFAARHLYSSGSKLETGNWQLFDVGSGAGFPGLPIKIWTPALQLTLLESNQRKATFLREVSRALQLTGVEVLTTRAETFAGQIPDHKSQITNATVTLRAVERFDEILPTAVRLLEHVPVPTRRLALLIGSSQIPAARDIATTLTWSDALPIPESSQRVLLIGNA